MKKIRQKHKTGCTVASLAMLLNISYEEALKLLYPDRKSGKVAGSFDLLVETFKREKIKTKFHNNLISVFTGSKDNFKIKDLKKPTLVCIYARDIANGNHAVVWDPIKKRILDPGMEKSFPIKWYQDRLTFAFELEE